MHVIIVWLRGVRALQVYFIFVISKYIFIINTLFTKDEKSVNTFFLQGLKNLTNYDHRLYVNVDDLAV